MHERRGFTTTNGAPRPKAILSVLYATVRFPSSLAFLVALAAGVCAELHFSPLVALGTAVATAGLLFAPFFGRAYFAEKRREEDISALLQERGFVRCSAPIDLQNLPSPREWYIHRPWTGMNAFEKRVGEGRMTVCDAQQRMSYKDENDPYAAPDWLWHSAFLIEQSNLFENQFLVRRGHASASDPAVEPDAPEWALDLLQRHNELAAIWGDRTGVFIVSDLLVSVEQLRLLLPDLEAKAEFLCGNKK